MKKYSLLGLSLFTVSAFTAAFAPSSKQTKASLWDGRYDLSTGTWAHYDMTCREFDQEMDAEPNCSWTVTMDNRNGGSSTSGLSIASRSMTFSQLGPIGFTDSYTGTTYGVIE